jgi:hypothetical protein
MPTEFYEAQLLLQQKAAQLGPDLILLQAEGERV